MTDTTTTPAPVKVGDIFYTSWGYDQTNVDWFQVVDVSATGKTVTLVEIGAIAEDSDGPHDRLMPAIGVAICKRCNATEADRWMHHDPSSPCFHSFEQNELRRRPKPGWRGGWVVTISECQTGFSWDGASKYQTGAGHGH